MSYHCLPVTGIQVSNPNLDFFPLVLVWINSKMRIIVRMFHVRLCHLIDPIGLSSSSNSCTLFHFSISQFFAIIVLKLLHPISHWTCEYHDLWASLYDITYLSSSRPIDDHITSCCYRRKKNDDSFSKLIMPEQIGLSVCILTVLSPRVVLQGVRNCKGTWPVLLFVHVKTDVEDN